MLREIGWEKFLEWMDFDRLEPIGGRRGDWQAASICAVIANLEMIRQGRRKRFQIKDFILEFTEQSIVKERTEATNWQAMKMIARMQVALANADDGRKKQHQKGGR